MTFKSFSNNVICHLFILFTSAVLLISDFILLVSSFPILLLYYALCYLIKIFTVDIQTDVYRSIHLPWPFGPILIFEKSLNLGDTSNSS